MKDKNSSLIGIIIIALWAILLLYIIILKLKSVSVEYNYDMNKYIEELVVNN